MFIVITGNLADGMDFIGPFDDHEAALKFAHWELIDTDWWVVSLTSEEEFRKENG